MTPFFRTRTLVASLLALGSATLAWSIGSPPLITDDPGMPEPGHWEINVGFSTEDRAGERATEAPLLDLNYGITEHWQVAFEVPYLVHNVEGEGRVSGWGNSAFGVKWLFHDGGEKGFSMAVSPAVEFNTPGTSSDDRGLVESGTAFVLPVQLEKSLGPVTLNLQAGREFHPGGDSWLYGVAVSRDLTPKVAVGIELAGRATPGLDRSTLTANVGLSVDVNQVSSFMVSVGREFHNHDEARASLVAYVGWQFRL